MRKTWRLTALLCAVGVLLGVLFSVHISAVDEAWKPVSGTCGDNLFWNFDEKTGILKIEGTGVMADVGEPADVPWYHLMHEIKRVEIAEGVTSIRYCAFMSSQMEEIDIPESVTGIGSDAFSGTPWLDKQMKDNNFVIQNNILLIASNCEGNVEIPQGVVRIATNAVSGFRNPDLTGIIIPDSVVCIEEYAFSGCEKLEDITIPESVTQIGSMAFAQTSWLNNQKQQKPMVIVNDIVLDGQECEGNIMIPDHITSIADGAFSYSKISGAELPADLEKIGDAAFSGCNNITEIVIPDKVSEIGDRAFASCAELHKITVSGSKTKIGSMVFEGCTKLSEITLSQSVNEIGEQVFGSIWSDSNDTLWLKEQKEKSEMVTVNGILIDGRKCKDKIVVPDGISQIGACAFYEDSDLSEIILPDSITNIGDAACYSCQNLTEVVIPEGTKTIGNYAFAGCNKLTKIVIPKSVKCIGVTALPYFKTDDYGIRQRNDSLTVQGYSGTFAEKYAKAYELNFESLGEAPEQMTGDFDGDDKISVEDAQNVLSVYTRTMSGKDAGLTDAQIKACDINSDGNVDVADAQLILLYYVKNTLAKTPTDWSELIPE